MVPTARVAAAAEPDAGVLDPELVPEALALAPFVNTTTVCPFVLVTRMSVQVISKGTKRPVL